VQNIRADLIPPPGRFVSTLKTGFLFFRSSSCKSQSFARKILSAYSRFSLGNAAPGHDDNAGWNMLERTAVETYSHFVRMSAASVKSQSKSSSLISISGFLQSRASLQSKQMKSAANYPH